MAACSLADGVLASSCGAPPWATGAATCTAKVVGVAGAAPTTFCSPAQCMPGATPYPDALNPIACVVGCAGDNSISAPPLMSGIATSGLCFSGMFVVHTTGADCIDGQTPTGLVPGWAALASYSDPNSQYYASCAPTPSTAAAAAASITATSSSTSTSTSGNLPPPAVAAPDVGGQTITVLMPGAAPPRRSPLALVAGSLLLALVGAARIV